MTTADPKFNLDWWKDAHAIATDYGEHENLVGMLAWTATNLTPKDAREGIT